MLKKKLDDFDNCYLLLNQKEELSVVEPVGVCPVGSAFVVT